MTAFVHDRALCETDQLGARSQVQAFAHVLAGARIGADCVIGSGVTVGSDVVLGDRVALQSGVQLPDGVRLHDDVLVGANATFTKDRFPRSGAHLDVYPRTEVAAGASIGANATILPGVSIGRNAMIGAGSVITKDVPPNAVVAGNPGRIVGYAGAEGTPAAPTAVPEEWAGSEASDNYRLHRLRKAVDMRGSLVAAEFTDLPFEPRRTFVVYGVPGKEVRGEHAHRECEQFLVCLNGSVTVLADDGESRQEFVLDDPGVGIHLKPMTWGTQYKYSPGAVLMVFASHPYDDADYIRDYDEFVQLVQLAAAA